MPYRYPSIDSAAVRTVADDVTAIGGLLALAVESATTCTSMAFRLLAANIAFSRNLYESAGILRSSGTGARAAADSMGQPVIEIERDGRIGIDLKFGSITFKEEDKKTYAEALVDVLIAAADMAPSGDTRVQMNVKIAADPDHDSIMDVTERFRRHIVATLRAAADTLDDASARTLLFHQAEAA